MICTRSLSLIGSVRCQLRSLSASSNEVDSLLHLEVTHNAVCLIAENFSFVSIQYDMITVFDLLNLVSMNQVTKSAESEDFQSDKDIVMKSVPLSPHFKPVTRESLTTATVWRE